MRGNGPEKPSPRNASVLVQYWQVARLCSCTVLRASPRISLTNTTLGDKSEVISAHRIHPVVSAPLRIFERHLSTQYRSFQRLTQPWFHLLLTIKPRALALWHMGGEVCACKMSCGLLFVSQEPGHISPDIEIIKQTNTINA